MLRRSGFPGGGAPGGARMPPGPLPSLEGVSPRFDHQLRSIQPLRLSWNTPARLPAKASPPVGIGVAAVASGCVAAGRRSVSTVGVRVPGPWPFGLRSRRSPARAFRCTSLRFGGGMLHCRSRSWVLPVSALPPSPPVAVASAAGGLGCQPCVTVGPVAPRREPEPGLRAAGATATPMTGNRAPWPADSLALVDPEPLPASASPPVALALPPSPPVASPLVAVVSPPLGVGWLSP